jgi:hypothetical protein
MTFSPPSVSQLSRKCWRFDFWKTDGSQWPLIDITLPFTKLQLLLMLVVVIVVVTAVVVQHFACDKILSMYVRGGQDSPGLRTATSKICASLSYSSVCRTYPSDEAWVFSYNNYPCDEILDKLMPHDHMGCVWVIHLFFQTHLHLKLFADPSLKNRPIVSRSPFSSTTGCVHCVWRWSWCVYSSRPINNIDT